MTSTQLKHKKIPYISGFTLVELMVTISVAAILMAVATPSYTTFIRNSQLSDAVGEFMSAANAARGNAIKQGINTFVIPATGTDWKTGWIVFADGNWDGVYTASEPKDVLIMQSPATSSILTITTPTANSLADGYLLFNGSGYPKKKLPDTGFATGQIVMANTSRSTTIMINSTGRVRSCKTDAPGCTAP